MGFGRDCDAAVCRHRVRPEHQSTGKVRQALIIEFIGLASTISLPDSMH